jgi:hypothetical protein
VLIHGVIGSNLKMFYTSVKMKKIIPLQYFQVYCLSTPLISPDLNQSIDKYFNVEDIKKHLLRKQRTKTKDKVGSFLCYLFGV